MDSLQCIIGTRCYSISETSNNPFLLISNQEPKIENKLKPASVSFLFSVDKIDFFVVESNKCIDK